jgi:hypothetical protein
MAEHTPQPPCLAYREVVACLPPWYLVAHCPPDKGRKLIVTSRIDRVSSYWEFDPDTARFVFDKLRDTGRPVDCTSTNYDNR